MAAVRLARLRAVVVETRRRCAVEGRPSVVPAHIVRWSQGTGRAGEAAGLGPSNHGPFARAVTALCDRGWPRVTAGATTSARRAEPTPPARRMNPAVPGPHPHEDAPVGVERRHRPAGTGSRGPAVPPVPRDIPLLTPRTNPSPRRPAGDTRRPPLGPDVAPVSAALITLLVGLLLGLLVAQVTRPSPAPRPGAHDRGAVAQVVVR
ncbi:hypothetical protein GCM10023200_24350 [Actinomycetospora chlora]|uniref:Uncharacterized protein n=1 Tax=Actinomycetospora chlora TaxID=663608 RepID=A0ABP9B0F6_9PSEU